MINNFFENWYKDHRGFEIRDYANRILNYELPAAYLKDNVAILAAAPNSGKTIMAISWLEKYMIDNPSHRVLILAHNQKELRNQFYNEIEKSKVNFTYEKIESAEKFLVSKKQVIITIPSTILGTISHAYNSNQFDLLIVDEAHHYYVIEDGMVSKIIKKFKFKKQLLLTGTPSPFIAKNMKIIPVTLEELVDGGYCSDPIVNIVKTPSEIKSKDIGKDHEVKKSISIGLKETTNSLDNLLTIIEERTSVKGWRNSINKLNKTLFVCRRIEQAIFVSDYFESIGIETLLSTSDYDPSNESIKMFTTDPKNKILIVVDRAILGFNFPELVSVVDMKYGKNINNLFQLFNRITRLHPDKNTQKYFFKIVPELLEEQYTYMLSAAISLMVKENYMKYNGYTSETLKVRVRSNKNAQKSFSKNGLSTTFRNQPINYLDVSPVFKMWKDENSLYTWSTLKEVYNTLITHREKRYWSKFSEDENYEYCLDTFNEFVKKETAA